MIDSDSPMREWLAGVLRGGVVTSWPKPGREEVLAVATAENEGVACLVHQGLYDGPCASECPAALRAAFAVAARGAAARSLGHLGESRRVAALLEGAGIPVLWLKGSALAYWLYSSPHLRECGDIDLLLSSRGDVDRALELLEAVGYSFPVRTIPGDLVIYELLCVGSNPNATNFEIDLHWKLCNTPLFCDRLQWDELIESAIPLPTFGTTAMGLAPIHALLHACLHRAHNLQFRSGNRLRWLYDLKLLAQRLDTGQWHQLVLLAQGRGVAGACLHGLLAAQRDLGAEVPADVLATLGSAARYESLQVDRMQSWLYAQCATARALPTLRLRLRWIRQRLFPDLNYLREKYGDDTGGLAVTLWRRLHTAWARMRAAP